VIARRDEVLGERAYPSLAALPEVPDHVYVVANTDATIEAIEECGRLGVPVVTALANGFAEVGAEGHARETRLREIVARTKTRIVGPSSLGVVDLRHKTFLTANAAFDEKDLPVGRIFAASHSGGMIGTFLSRGKARGIGFAGLVSVGNEVDLSIGEICAATLDDPGIDGYVLFLETMRKAGALRAFALQAAACGKPILAYKLGRSAAARELAVSHTGALAGEDDIADVFLKECGIARVDTLEGLIEGFPLLARVPARARGARRATVAVVTTTAGGATMVVDPLARNGIAVGQPSAQTLARLNAATGIEIAPARIIDVTLAGAQYKVMKAALDVLTTAPEFDLVVAAIGSSARFYPDLAVKPIIDSAGAGKPIAAFLVPEAPDALARLSAAGVPNFHTPEACADAVAAALRRTAPRPIEVRPRASAGTGRILDELEAYAQLDRIGVPRAPSVAVDAAVTKAPVLPFDYPVAVKALSATIAHKSDVGGVVLNIGDEASLLAAIGKIRGATKVDRVLVQPMTAGLGEVLIGYRVDSDVGPLVMLAAGGILAEIHRDRSLRLAPVDLDEAKAMIGEVASLEALAGYRGRPAGDLDAVARALVALSQLAVADGAAVAEAEVNPLIVKPQGQGAVAVDALVRLA
jgi:acyl-CoA synthetase (NDP forming)